MDRWEELVAENEGEPSPHIERQRKIAKIKALQQIETDIAVLDKTGAFEQMSIEEALEDWARFHGDKK
jgi:hypothetical protein